MTIFVDRLCRVGKAPVVPEGRRNGYGAIPASRRNHAVG
jgi:hypothetical protein